MIWLNINGYDGTYQISDTGMVQRTLDNDETRIVKPFKASNGSAAITLWKNGLRKVYMLHNLYAETFQVSPEDAMSVIYANEGLGENICAKNNLRKWLLEKIADCEQQMKEGVNMHTEIIYLKSFLRQL